MGRKTGRVKELQHVVAIGKQALSAGYTVWCKIFSTTYVSDKIGRKKYAVFKYSWIPLLRGLYLQISFLYFFTLLCHLVGWIWVGNEEKNVGVIDNVSIMD